MIDIGLSKLVLIGIVALIVIKPEHLPTVARTVGRLLGRVQRYLAAMRADMDQQLQLTELRQIQQNVRHIAREVHDDITSIEYDHDRYPSEHQAAQPNKQRRVKLASLSRARSQHKRRTHVISDAARCALNRNN